MKTKIESVHCRDCGTKLGEEIMEDQSRNGVRVIVRRAKDGSSVDASCSCFGLPMRAHSHDSCPNRLRLLAAQESV